MSNDKFAIEWAAEKQRREDEQRSDIDNELDAWTEAEIANVYADIHEVMVLTQSAPLSWS